MTGSLAEFVSARQPVDQWHEERRKGVTAPFLRLVHDGQRVEPVERLLVDLCSSWLKKVNTSNRWICFTCPPILLGEWRWRWTNCFSKSLEVLQDLTQVDHSAWGIRFNFFSSSNRSINIQFFFSSRFLLYRRASRCPLWEVQSAVFSSHENQFSFSPSLFFTPFHSSSHVMNLFLNQQVSIIRVTPVEGTQVFSGWADVFRAPGEIKDATENVNEERETIKNL